MKLLATPDWTTRESALFQMRYLAAPFPAALSSAIVTLVKQQALTPKFGAGSEDYGEYLIDLLVAVTKTGDKSTIPAVVALGGLGVSDGVAAFVASGGPSVLPLLDSVQASTPLEAGALLETVALMYAQQGGQLGPSDSANIMSRLLAAASSPIFTARQVLPYLALRIPLPALLPALSVMAASDTFQLLPEGVFPVRLAAQAAVDTLSAAWSALSGPTLLVALTQEQAGACVAATGALHGHCQAMGAHLADLAKQMGSGRSNPAREAIKNFRKALQQAASDGLAATTVALLDANAVQLSLLLGN